MQLMFVCSDATHIHVFEEDPGGQEQPHIFQKGFSNE